MSEEFLLRVAVPVPLRKPFDYLPPAGVAARLLRPGVRLRLPFGRRTLVGVLLERLPLCAADAAKLKPAEELLDPVPLLDSESLGLLRWAADYYQHPIGEVVSAALPARLRAGNAPPESGEPGWQLTEAGRALDPATIKRAPKQRAVLRYLAEFGACSRARLQAEVGASAPVLKTLRANGWLEPCRVESSVSQPSADGVELAGPALHDEQAAAVEAIRAADGFAGFLLDGVTGSGKTEVYLAAVVEALKHGRQALLLVPEIALTPQLLARFAERLRVPLAVLHSGLSDGERERAWLDAAAGRARVVVGTRSAIWTPMPELGLVVVDEEHDLSFKQQDGFRYSARDLAVVRARRQDCVVLLGSATPSLESLHNARLGRYAHLRLRQRAGNARPPQIGVVDIRKVRLDAGLSPQALRAIGDTLGRGQQVLVFLNRRGFAPLLVCHQCGWTAQCRRCDARMTVHAGQSLLWCHHCGSQRPVDLTCPECGSRELRASGQGTQRIETALAQAFPDHPVLRVDRDSTRAKGSMDRLLGRMHDGGAAILVGTQMLAKGHHFPNVTLALLVDIDQGLYGADFRASERMAQQVLQVAGRSGRAAEPGRVLIQTRHPDHPLLQTLIGEGYAAFAEQALTERQQAQFPPFTYQALLRAEAADADLPSQFLSATVEQAQSVDDQGVCFWGPVPAPMERRAGRVRAHLLLQSPDRARLRRFLADWLPRIDALPLARKVRWSVDVDPQEML